VLLGLSAATLLAAPISAAHANLILASSSLAPIGIGGTGLGSVNTVLTLQQTGNLHDAAGCAGARPLWTSSVTSPVRAPRPRTPTS
jgi:hypothetical protein